MLKKRQSGNEGVSRNAKMCNKIHVGWICQYVSTAMTIKSHIGTNICQSEKSKNVTIVQGDYIKAL